MYCRTRDVRLCHDHCINFADHAGRRYLSSFEVELVGEACSESARARHRRRARAPRERAEGCCLCVLCEPGGRLRHVYFPITSIASLLYAMEDGASAEIAVVGNEGMLGISLFMGGETTPSHAVVQSAGYGVRLKARLLKQEFARFRPMMHLLLRYTQALITQMAQTAVCNRHHSVDQQLCRWLLLKPRSVVVERTVDDAGADRQHAGRLPRRRHRGRRQAAGCRSHQVPPRPHHRARSLRFGGAVLRVLSGRQEGIRSSPALRCQIGRSCSTATDAVSKHGIPLVLDQLIKMLSAEQTSHSIESRSIRSVGGEERRCCRDWRDCGATQARADGARITVDQVVHDLAPLPGDHGVGTRA